MDTGANVYTLINQKHIRSLIEVLQMLEHKLIRSIPLWEFDGQPSEAIQQVLEVNLSLRQHV
jgi:hypothetical protein